MYLSDKQQSIMEVIAAGNPDGTGVDMNQILERVNYRTSKASMVFSLRALRGHGLIRKQVERELRNERVCTIYVPTTMGKTLLTNSQAFTMRAGKIVKENKKEALSKITDKDITELFESIDDFI